MRTKAAGFAGMVLVLGALWQAAPAGAAGEPAFACGHAHYGKAQRNPFANAPGPRELRLPPIAIGDSTMLLPIPDLTRVGFDVDAMGCRGFKTSIEIAEQLANQGKLPRLVVTNAYGNGGVNPDLIDFALDVLGPQRKLVIVTAYNADTGEPPAPDTDVVFQAEREHPDQIKVLDWVKYSLPHHKIEPAPGAWFLPDLFHPNFTGAPQYANFLARVLPGGPPEETSSSSSGSDDGGTSWWPFAVGGAVLLAALGFFLLRRWRA